MTYETVLNLSCFIYPQGSKSVVNFNSLLNCLPFNDSCYPELNHKEGVYKKAVMNGVVEVVYCRVMLLGPGGVGKTSLKRGLMGIELEDLANSTIGADVHSLKPVLVERGKDEACCSDDALEREWVTGSFENEWKEVTEQDEIEELAKLIASIDDVKDDDDQSSKADQNKFLKDRSSKEYHETVERLMNSKILDEALKMAKEIKSKKIPRPNPSPYFHLWDCGGQPVFQEVLPVFLTARTMFLLLFNATEDLDANIESLQYLFGNKKHRGYVNMSTLQLIEGWMSNIHSYLLKIDEHGCFFDYPRVIPVGTRGDKLTKDERDKVIEHLEKTCCNKEKAFFKVLKEPVIIDNTTAGKGEKEDKMYQVLRQKISDFAIKELTVLTPITWVLYRKVLQLLVKESRNKNIITLDEAAAIGIVCKVRSSDVHAVLRFYHDLGVLLYYPDISGLENKIILDPKWFVDCLGMILTLPGVEEEEADKKIEWDLLRTKGILVQPLYVSIWKKCEGIDPDSLIQLLVTFRLAVQVETDEYHVASVKQFFVPAVLPYYIDQPSQQAREGSGRASPFHITFKTGYVIPGFFTRFITTIAEHPTCNLDCKKDVFHNRVTYRFGKSAATLVTFTESSNVIAVDVRRLGPDMPNELQKNCLEIKDLCNSCSQTVEECLQLDNEKRHSSKIPRDMKVVCQQEKCLSSGAGIHYLEYSPLEMLISCQNDDKPYSRRITRDEACWFEDINMAEFEMETNDTMSSSLSSIGSTINPNVLSCRPGEMEVVNLLKPNAYEWDNIGLGLSVPFGYREELRRQGVMSTSTTKLDSVIHEWMETECSEVTWNTIFKVLKGLKYVEIASDVEKFLLSKEVQ